jgi:hypothetical protein
MVHVPHKQSCREHVIALEQKIERDNKRIYRARCRCCGGTSQGFAGEQLEAMWPVAFGNAFNEDDLK